MESAAFYERYWRRDGPASGMFDHVPAWSPGLLAKKVSWVAPYLRGHWLDAGCGDGTFANALLKCGGGQVRVTGVDLSRAAVRAAKKRYPDVRFVRGDVGALPFRSGALDGISALEVVEHVLDTEVMFAEFARVLKPGGFLCITTPQFTRLKALAIAFCCLDGYFEPRSPHVRYYTRKNMERELVGAGFSVVHYRPDGSFFPGLPKGLFVVARKR